MFSIVTITNCVKSKSAKTQLYNLGWMNAMLAKIINTYKKVKIPPSPNPLFKSAFGHCMTNVQMYHIHLPFIKTKSFVWNMWLPIKRDFTFCYMHTIRTAAKDNIFKV